MMVDDAHASGVFGKNGRGTVDHWHARRVDVQVGTLSKLSARSAGKVAGSKALIDFLCHRARPFLFSTSHPPSVAATCLAALDGSSRNRRSSIGCGQHPLFGDWPASRLRYGISESPITPVVTGDGALAMKLSDRLFAEGVFAQGIAFPPAKGKARAHIVCDTYEGRAQFALDKFRKVGKELGLI
jgi:glycine C-acetyltransferase